jgi:hypothetical protein
MQGLLKGRNIEPVKRRARHLSRTCILLVLSLLFQHAAMAAYTCTVTQTPADTAGVDEACASMQMKQTAESPALCAKHCAPDQSLAPANPVPDVPTLALPPPAYPLVLSTRIDSMACETLVPVERSDPPPRLRYCSLLI